MCAIDALGIAYLTHRPAEIEAREPGSAEPISVRVDPAVATLRVSPPSAVAVAASSGSGCTAGCACPHINLFASQRAAERYLALPELRGAILTIPVAAAAGRRLFGDLLERLADPKEH
jgi:hypothetical protein